MTTNELTKPTNGEIVATDRADMIRAEMAAEDERNAFDFMPTRIIMPTGGAKFFTLSDGDALQPFTGVIAVSQKARAYWPDKDAQGLPPICSSADSVQGWFAQSPDETQLASARAQSPRHPSAERFPDDPGPFPCARCPLQSWGSGEGRGQACKTLRRLIILPDGWQMPALLTLPPTSVKIFDQFASARASRGAAYFSCRTQFDLDQKRSEGGVNYSVISLSVVDELPDGDLGNVMALRAQFSELVRSLDIMAAEYEQQADGGQLPPF